MSKLKFKKQILLRVATVLLAALSMMNTACSTKEIEELTNNSVGGTVRGLEGTLVIENNSSDEIVITSDGKFTFPSELGITNRYLVHIVEQPEGQTCSVENASGVMSVVKITDVTIVCSANTYLIGGSVTGLTGTVVLQNNGTDSLTISADGIFAFATEVAEGAAFNATVLTQPGGQTCVVSNGSGITTADVTNISVVCGP